MKNTLIYLLCLMSHLAISQDTLVLQPGPESKDAYINDFFPENSGDYPNNFAMAGTSSGNPFVCRSLIEFDLSDIPTGSFILEARLSLYFANNPWNPHTHYGDNEALLRRIIEPWDEYTVTWYNQPLSTEENQVVLPVSEDPEQDYLDINVTSLIQDIYSNPGNSHGMLFRLATEEMYRRMMFASSDYEDPELWPKLLIIYGECAPPVADYIYTSEELDIFFQDSSLYAEEYYWDFGDGYYSDLMNPWHQYQSEGIYEVCLTTLNSCWSDTECKWIEVCELPQSAFSFEIIDLTAFFENQSLKADSYFWDFGDGYYSDLLNPIHIYDTPENYQVCLTTWNDCGTDTTCQVLYLNTVSITEVGEGCFSVYPNPARDNAFIKTDGTGQAVISLLDLNGKEMIRQELDLNNNETFRFDLGDLEPGLYIVRFISGMSQSFKKLVVVR